MRTFSLSAILLALAVFAVASPAVDQRDSNKDYKRDSNKDYKRDSNKDYKRDSNKDYKRDSNKDY
ncbi:hypothetical protein V8E53_013012 [Lactarius tabidus]